MSVHRLFHLHGLKHGQRSTTLRHLAEPHPAILCNEDSRTFFQLFHNLIKFYQPIGQVPLDIVREIAMLGGDVSKFVFPSVDRWLQKKIASMTPPAE